MNQYLDSEQQRVLARMISSQTSNVFILWWDMGTGKTRVALFAFEQSGYDDLIVICRRVAFEDWIKEMILVGLDFNVYQDNYNGKSLVHLANTKKPKRMLLISHGSLHKLPERFPKGQFLTIDELYLFSNPKSKRSKQLQAMSLFCSARLGLSGTIMPSRDNITIFGQFEALNAGRVLASGTTEFKTKYQNRSKGSHGMLFSNKPGAAARISKIVAPYVDIYKPERRMTRIQKIEVTATAEQKALYREVKELYKVGGRQFKHAIELIPVIFGISNGWINYQRHLIQTLESPKIERLKQLCEELHAQGSKAVIWCGMHLDIWRIEQALSNFSLCRFTGKDKFDEDSDYDFCLATVANGASVNHFRNVKYGIYFSINFKWLDLEQSMMRHERKSSEHDGAHYYFLQTKGLGDARAHYLVMESKKQEDEVKQILAKELL